MNLREFFEMICIVLIMHQVNCEIWMPVRVQPIIGKIVSFSLEHIQPPYSMNRFALRRTTEATLIYLTGSKRAGQNAAFDQIKVQVQAAVVPDIL